MTDQLISYYHLDARCMRTWIPMFLQTISIIRTNSYIVYAAQTFNHKPLNHKQFTLAMIKALLNEADWYFQRPDEDTIRTTGQSTSQADPINATASPPLHPRTRNILQTPPASSPSIQSPASSAVSSLLLKSQLSLVHHSTKIRHVFHIYVFP